MNHWMFVETRDPAECRDTDWIADLAARLKRGGAETTVFFAENGVFAARDGAQHGKIAPLLKAGINVIADSFALAERGIRQADLVRGVAIAGIDAVMDRLEAGATVIWK